MKEYDETTDPLFRPFTVRGKTLRNRVVMAPMVTLRGVTTARGIRWYGEHAEGGVGLVVVESTPVSRFLSGDRCPCAAAQLTACNLSPLADAVHAGGALAVMQLYPETPETPADADPNSVPIDALRSLAADCAAAAKVCADAGFDGVEVHGAHGFFLNRLASAVTNARRDEYAAAGRFACDLCGVLRAALPASALLLYRHSLAGGTHATPEDACDPEAADETARLSHGLRAAGVDLLDLSPGGCSRHVGRISALVRAAPGGCALPVVSVGGMDSPAAAREALRGGACDLVAIGRGLIADAQWCNKVREGRESAIVRCLRCNMGCMSNLQHHLPISCLRWDPTVTF